MTEWSLLPRGTQHLIFEILAQDLEAKGSKTRTKKSGLSQYALVCKTWQEFFEKKLYRHLTLDPSSLDDFDEIVHRQRTLVEHIWLRVELETYKCPDCVRFRKVSDYEANSAIIGDTINWLFYILSTWDCGEVKASPDLVLEISAYSPSDMQHIFKNDLYFDTSPFTTGELEDLQPKSSHQHHGWVNGQRSRAPDIDAISRIFGPVSPDFGSGLSVVRAVRGLVIRRQTRHHFDPGRMVRSLPNLRFMNYEPWREFFCFADGKYHADSGERVSILLISSNNLTSISFVIGTRMLVSHSLPRTLKDLTIFEDFNEDYTFIHCTDMMAKEYPCPPELVRTPSQAVGAALAKRSLSLNRLAASYMVDAADFFKVTKPEWSWNSLTAIHLTSRFLVSAVDASLVNRLLLYAGMTALQMPKLRKMNVWNGTRGNACTFRYEVTDGLATVGWHGTWDLALESRVIDVWEKVARRHTGRSLTVRRSRLLDQSSITSHAIAIQELGLSNDVIHPVSLKQIKKETERYFWKY
ncbi:hypothetical protein AK830_g8303 [Neonectria ditissima]|uniref:DUF6546 domain-containing protein n=1 Tax=Neonectria ditissima TaxID=78410 RepID=A0A0P7B8B7_9HYPO|nr:hypothetical protein AK830_g8303 [Neonectria ditissima]